MHGNILCVGMVGNMGYYKAVKLCKSVNTELLFLVIKSNDIDDHFSKNTLPVNHCMNKHPTKLLLMEALTCGGGSLADEDAHRSTLLWHHAIFRTPSGPLSYPSTHTSCASVTSAMSSQHVYG